MELLIITLSIWQIIKSYSLNLHTIGFIEAVLDIGKDIAKRLQSLPLQQVRKSKAGKAPPERKASRPQKESIIEQLTRLKKEAQEQPRQRKVPQRSSRDMER